MWIITLLEQVTGFIPRPFVIRPDEAGFRQIPKPWGSTWLTKMEPGNWYWIVPWIMEYETCKTKVQIKDIRAQSVWTKDGEELILGTSVRYYVKDSMKAQLDVLDYDQSLENAILGIVCDFARKHDIEEIKSEIGDLREILLKSVKEVSKGWGLQIQDITTTDTGRAKNLRVLLSGLGSFTSVFE